MLQDKSMTELRAIYQGLGGSVSMGDEKKDLIQKIELRTKDAVPAPEPVLPNYNQDLRLLVRPPSDLVPREDIESLLAPYVELGLRITYPTDDQWHMRYREHEDSGSLRGELRIIMQCAQKLCR